MYSVSMMLAVLNSKQHGVGTVTLSRMLQLNTPKLATFLKGKGGDFLQVFICAPTLSISPKLSANNTDIVFAAVPKRIWKKLDQDIK